MNRRGLLLAAALIALGGALVGFWGPGRDGGGRGGDVGPDADDGASAGGPRSADEPSARATSLANEGRDPRPTTGLGSVIARIVRKSDGHPFAGVVVRLDGVSGTGSRLDVTTTSDGQGDVRFDDVGAGAGYAVHVLRDPGPSVELRAVIVTALETTDLGRIALEALGHLDVLVLDEERSPIEGAAVSVSLVGDSAAELDAGPWPLESELPGGFTRGTTDYRGRARIEGVPPGPVAVRATTSTLRGRTFRALVPPDAGGTQVVVFVLSIGRNYVGRVIGADGLPIKDARVEFGRNAAEGFDTAYATRTTDDGAFAIRGCKDIGPFSVRVSAAKYAPVITSPDVWKPIEIVLSGGCTLVLRAIDAVSRRPVSSARVSATPIGADPGRRTPEMYEGRSGSDGVAEVEFPSRSWFGLRIVEENHRTLVLERAGAESTVSGGEVLGDIQTPILSGERRELTVALTNGDTLSCRVTTPGPPYVVVPGALVRLYHGERRIAEALSDGMGELVFPNALLADRSPRLLASANGFYATETRVADARVERDGRIHKHIFLAPKDSPIPRTGRPFGTEDQTISVPVSISGRVVASDRRAVSGALVRVPGFARSARTGADGSFHFRDVLLQFDPRQWSTSTVSLVVEKGRDLVTATRSLSMSSAGKPLEFGDLELVAASEVVGVTLRRDSSDRTRFPLVELFRIPESEPAYRVETLVGGEFGDFSFSGLSSGKYRIRAQDAIGAGKTSMILVDGGRASPSFIEVRLRDATICAGRIEDRDGKPLDRIVVRVTMRRDHSIGEIPTPDAVAVTDASGAFRVSCYGTSPERATFAPDPGEPALTIDEPVHQGQDNVIRVKTYQKPPVR